MDSTYIAKTTVPALLPKKIPASSTYTVSRALQLTKGISRPVSSRWPRLDRLQRAGERRHVAAESDDQRQEGPPGQADQAHQPVHDEGSPGQITRVLQHRQQREHDGHQRHEAQQLPD